MLTSQSAVTFGIALLAMLAGGTRVASQAPTRASADVESLAPLVGEWQSDTVNGTSARSSCVWTPRHGGILCEQRVEGSAGTSAALNLFVPDAATHEFALYVLSRRGEAVSPVPLEIHASVWIYGGKTAAGDGRYYRTVNDFSRTDVYTWRQEQSVDGKQWTPGIHGQSRRVR